MCLQFRGKWTTHSTVLCTNVLLFLLCPSATPSSARQTETPLRSMPSKESSLSPPNCCVASMHPRRRRRRPTGIVAERTEGRTPDERDKAAAAVRGGIELGKGEGGRNDGTTG